MLCSGSCSASSHSFQFLSCAKAVPMADKLTITNAAAIAEAISVFTLLSYLVWCALSFRDNLRYRVTSHPWWSRHACGWSHFLVAYTSTRDLLLCAKHLFVAASHVRSAMACHGAEVHRRQHRADAACAAL